MSKVQHSLSLLVLAAFLALAGTPLRAAMAPAAWQRGWNRGRHQQTLIQFDEFLSHHPWIAHHLWQNPSRANSKGFVNGNPELKYWLENHPWARNQFRADARGFMERVRDFERSSRRFAGYGQFGPWNSQAARRQMAQFGQFLDDNPGIANELARNPSLVDARGYLHHHKELRAFLDSHPAVRRRLNNNPGAFFAWYGSFDWSAH